MMIIPLAPGFMRRGNAPATKHLVVANLVAYGLFNLLLPREYLDSLALHSTDLWTPCLLSYAFLHGDLWHLLGNVIFLIPFCAIVEEKLGYWKTWALYLASAVVAGWGWAYLNERADLLVGASGAVAAMMGASLVLRPHVKIQGIWFILIFPLFPFASPVWLWASVYFLLDNWRFLVSLQSPQVVAIAFEAHIVGFLFAFVCCWLAIRLGLVPGTSSDLVSTLRKVAEGQSDTSSRPQAWDVSSLLEQTWQRLEATEEIPIDGLVALSRLAERSGRGTEAYRLLQRWMELHDADPNACEVASELGLLSLKSLVRPDLARAWLEDALRRGARGDLRDRIVNTMQVL